MGRGDWKNIRNANPSRSLVGVWLAPSCTRKRYIGFRRFYDTVSERL
jgi:hypothetical protein